MNHDIEMAEGALRAIADGGTDTQIQVFTQQAIAYALVSIAKSLEELETILEKR